MKKLIFLLLFCAGCCAKCPEYTIIIPQRDIQEQLYWQQQTEIQKQQLKQMEK